MIKSIMNVSHWWDCVQVATSLFLSRPVITGFLVPELQSREVANDLGLSPTESALIQQAKDLLESKLRATLHPPIECTPEMRGLIEPAARRLNMQIPIAKDFLTLWISPLKREVFATLFLDNQNRLIAPEILFSGTVNAASVYPRIIAQRAMRHNASAIIIAHNHPAGDSEPSDSDIKITRLTSEAMDLVGVRLIDHIVVGNGETVSMAQRGMI